MTHVPTETPFTLPGFDTVLGVTYREISDERVVATFPIRPELHQPYGIVHGGVHCSAIEGAASVGAATWYGDRGRVVGVSNQTDFLRAATEGELTATATPLHRGRLQQLWQVVVTDAAGRTIARGQVRLQNLPNPEKQ